MQKFFDPFRLAALSCAAALLLACGGGGDANTDGASNEGGADDGAAAPAIDPATTGSISGTITYTGPEPEPTVIDMSEEPTCAEKHDGQPMRTPILVSDAGALKNVFVYIKEGLADRNWGSPGGSVEFDQDGCEYIPHVLGVRTGQDIEIVNSDGLLHNINVDPSINRGFNISQPTNMTSERTFSQQEIMIPVHCDVHGWMEAYIGVVAHPFFAVTGDDGTFRIEGIPAGQYTLGIWHEELGEREMAVTVAAQEDATADFTLDDSTAGTASLGEPLVIHHEHPGAAAGR